MRVLHMCTEVSYRGWETWNFPPPLSSSFPLQALLTSAIYFPTPRASRPLPCHLKYHDYVLNTVHTYTSLLNNIIYCDVSLYTTLLKSHTSTQQHSTMNLISSTHILISSTQILISNTHILHLT